MVSLVPDPQLPQSQLCRTSHGYKVNPWICPDFCCGSCYDQYCCSDVLKQVVWIEEDCHAASFNGHPYLVPDFRENAFNFSPLRIVFARKRGVKGGESNLARNQVATCPPQPGTLREIHRVM
ncbi:hypothetical protein FD754_022505 [Muntiacus muntjak]|uniref:Shisa N-terminal domain-containing protein n=1 Tax=Muntiacus muntjak TaxID=9888 RepID=A0A5N3V917_MUNMU|nr:hypothetical protein FD754_022505 [Muntiacus muntjak]